MPTFAYIARTTDGTLERGTLEAASSEEAREQLRKRHLFVEQLQHEDGPPQTVGFSGAPLPWTVTDTPAASATSAAAPAADETEHPYVPLTDTLRLFAGWLLAWYGLVYLLGSLQRSGRLPADIPFLEGLFTSPIVLRFTFGTFLFLLLTSIHRWMDGGVLKGLGLGVVFVGLLAAFHVLIG